MCSKTFCYTLSEFARFPDKIHMGDILWNVTLLKWGVESLQGEDGWG